MDTACQGLLGAPEAARLAMRSGSWQLTCQRHQSPSSHPVPSQVGSLLVQKEETPLRLRLQVIPFIGGRALSRGGSHGRGDPAAGSGRAARAGTCSKAPCPFAQPCHSRLQVSWAAEERPEPSMKQPGVRVSPPRAGSMSFNQHHVLCGAAGHRGSRVGERA